MKLLICCLLFLVCAIQNNQAQQYQFLKKEKPKYTFFSKPIKNTVEKYPPMISIYTIACQVNQPYNYYDAKGRDDNYSPNNFLSLTAYFAGKIFISVLADKMHYNHPNIPEYYDHR